VWLIKNILRNKRRTILIFISLAFALFLFVFLFTILTSMNQYFNSAHTKHTIYVYSTHFGIHNYDFPQTYTSMISKISHVKDITPIVQLFGYFEKSTELISTWGVDYRNARNFLEISNIEGTSWSDFAKEKSAALVGKHLMERYRWMIGDTIILKSSLEIKFSFIIRGIVHAPDGSGGNNIYLNLAYLQEIIGCPGRLSFMFIKADDGTFVPEICSKVETMFRNYPVEVATITQKSFMHSIVDKIKAILIAFRLIGWITIISTFLLVANCIAISIRERKSEIGVMRVLGFSQCRILALILTEPIIVSLGGGMIGTFSAYLLPTFYHVVIPTAMPLHVNPDGSLILYGFFISLLIGFLGGILPTLSSVRLKPSDAIRNIV